METTAHRRPNMSPPRKPIPKLVTLQMAAELVREPHHTTIRRWRERGWDPVGRWAGTMLFDSRQVLKWRGLYKGGKLRCVAGPGPDGQATWIMLRDLPRVVPGVPQFPPVTLYKWGPNPNSPYVVLVKDVQRWLKEREAA
jgi:hypothetical protein